MRTVNCSTHTWITASRWIKRTPNVCSREEIYRFDASRVAGVLVSRIISEARSGMGATKSTGPSYLIALRGMSGYAASSGFWTMAGATRPTRWHQDRKSLREGFAMPQSRRSRRRWRQCRDERSSTKTLQALPEEVRTPSSAPALHAMGTAPWRIWHRPRSNDR